MKKIIVYITINVIFKTKILSMKYFDKKNNWAKNQSHLIQQKGTDGYDPFLLKNKLYINESSNATRVSSR
jgi:hypothetical protein